MKTLGKCCLQQFEWACWFFEIFPIRANTQGPWVINLFSCSIQLSIKFHLLIKTEMLERKKCFLDLKLSLVVFIMLINVKMPTIIGILTLMSMINFSMKRDNFWHWFRPACKGFCFCPTHDNER